MLLQINKLTEKNPVWSYRTPNEYYQQPGLALMDPNFGWNYKQYVDLWAKKSGIGGKKLFFEVRLQETKTLIDVPTRFRWWDHPKLMGRVYWVFQTPLLWQVDNQHFDIYALEPMECLLVAKTMREELGYNPFTSETPSLGLPKECVNIAWNETAGGYSEHLRHRPEEVKTKEQLEKEQKVDEEVKQLLPQVQSIAEDKIEEVCGKPGEF